VIGGIDCPGRCEDRSAELYSNVTGWRSMGTPTPLEQDPVHLRQRAKAARCESARTADPITRETLTAIASAYDQLADLVEAKTRMEPVEEQKPQGDKF
jgi:hypothetical protein